MRFSQACVAFSCLGLLACATTTAPEPSGPPPDWKLASASMSTGNTLQATGPTGGQFTMLVDGHDLNGPTAHLFAGGGAIRGTGPSGKTVQVTVKGNRADGVVGNILFSCVVDLNPDGSAHVTGAMGAGNSDFIISPKQITGRIGGIVYNLTWTGSRYEGQMMPGGTAFLALPAVMATWSPVEVATLLSVLLT